MNKKIAYAILVCINPTIPMALSKEHMDEMIKDGKHMNSAPGILHALTTAGFAPEEKNVHITDGKFIRYYFENEYEVDENDKKKTRANYMAARKVIMDKVMELRKALTTRPASLHITSVSTDEKPKKVKKPSNNKVFKKGPKEEKFARSSKTRTPRKIKKSLLKKRVKKVTLAATELAGLSRSQIKRNKVRKAIIEFVNAWCDQKFETYKETMDFVRKNKGGKVEMAVAA